MARVERQSSPNITNRSYTITAEVTIPEGGAEGVLLAAGNRFGGYTLFVKDGRLVYEYNFGEVRYVIRSDAEIAAGPHTLPLRVRQDRPAPGARPAARSTAAVVGEGDLPQTWPFMAAQAGLHCGRDDGSPVSEQYAVPFTFTGTLHRVVGGAGGRPAARPGRPSTARPSPRIDAAGRQRRVGVICFAQPSPDGAEP